MHWDKTLLWILNIFKSLTASLLVALVFVSCGGKEPVDPTPTPGPGPDPKPPVETKDTKAPTITVKLTEKNVIAGVVVSVKDNQLFFDQDVAASWTDDISKSCKVELSLVPSGGQSKTINSGDKLEEAGTLQIKVSDEAGNSSSAEIKLTLSDTKAPEIDIKIPEKNVVAGVKISVQDNQLFFDQDIAASWKDDYSETFTTELYLFVDGCEPETINSGDVITKAGVFKIHVTDEFGNKSIAEITLLSVAITGLENLQNLSLQVDKEVNLLQGLSMAEGLSLVKVEIEQDGVRSEIPDATKYTPEVPGSINIILTLSRTDGSTIEVKVDNLTVRGFEYQSISITDLKPGDILPIIEQVESGDKQAYNHIDHLRLAEATRIRDMMWEYGAGIHSTDEYRQLMGRLVAGMVEEYPGGYDDFEVIGRNNPNLKGNEHSHREWSILHTLVDHANLKVVFTHMELWQDKLDSFIQDHPTSISIFWCSQYAQVSKDKFLKWTENDKVVELCRSGKLILFKSGGNIETENWILINKTFHRDIDGDEHGFYSLQANANGKNDASADKTLLVTIGTNAAGDIDQTDEIYASSVFPVGFHDQALFAWRAFPYHRLSDGKIGAEGNTNNRKYATSYTNYVNTAMMSICFQMYAEVKDVFELLEMVRSTALTDYVRLNGQTQPLQLINPAGLYKKYLTPQSLPASISADEFLPLYKGYYKGIVFDIPGAEVKIGDEWIAYDAKNIDLIFTQNPMDLEWRLNGALLRKYGYTPGQTLQGQIITVDDQWNGLRLEVPMLITIR